ncbi:MAG: hypothetical protein JW843_06385, partial [Candidatus Aminicenantes bacterium]|nr:hypothetical protein [Candidatus Aminicenantes bacterium]
MPLPIILTLLAFCSPVLPQAQIPPPSSSLTEHAEIRANEIQPPDMVMDILGIRPGLVIGEVG